MPDANCMLKNCNKNWCLKPKENDRWSNLINVDEPYYFHYKRSRIRKCYSIKSKDGPIEASSLIKSLKPLQTTTSWQKNWRRSKRTPSRSSITLRTIRNTTFRTLTLTHEKEISLFYCLTIWLLQIRETHNWSADIYYRRIMTLQLPFVPLLDSCIQTQLFPPY